MPGGLKNQPTVVNYLLSILCIYETERPRERTGRNQYRLVLAGEEEEYYRDLTREAPVTLPPPCCYICWRPPPR
jgi:hypothetical protein